MALSRISSPIKLTAWYALFGTVWIIGSDWLVHWLREEGDFVWQIDTFKGLLFIAATSGLLYLLTSRLVRRHVAAEEAARENQLRWQFALESAGDGLWDWDAKTNHVYFSKQWKAMLGFAEDELSDNLAEWEDRVHPDDRAHVQCQLALHWKGEVPYYVAEHRVRMKNGDYKWILDRGQIVSRAPDGQPLRMLGTHKDISEQKSAEARVADALAFVRTVLHHSPAGIIVYGPDGQTVMANETVARIVGTDVASLLKQNFRKIESWRRYGLLDAAERALASGREVVHSGEYVSSFGCSLWLEERFMSFQYAGARHLMLLVTDQSEQQRTLGHLHLMNTAVRAAPGGWVVTDAEGKIQWVNPGFTALTGYAAGEMIGQEMRLLRSGIQDAAFYAQMWQTIKRGEVWSGEIVNRRKNGTLYHEFMTIAPVRGSDGAITQFVAMKQDITERKGLELQLARAQRLESIGLLASGIAHDLNNIFAPISLSLEMLKLKYPAADGQKMLELIETSVHRGAGIVKQVLTFARGIESERVPLQPKYLVKELGQILHETMPRNIEIETRLAEGLPAIVGDATQLHQVLLNLAINARDAMPDGGQLTLRAENTLVDAARAARNPPLKPGPYVAFTVADTGSGMPPEVLEHMFEPFYTTKPRGKGTGLGLSTVYGIVRSHGGAVEVSTKLGVGSGFTVLLPVAGQVESRPDSRSPLPEPLQGAGRRVLVVDDEEPIRLITMHALMRHGFVAEVAIDGYEAKEIFLLDPTRFALVITDLMMPRMNGLELVRQIRPLAPALPIIVSSGLSEEKGEEAADISLSGLGVRTILRKPYAEAELLAALRQELLPERPAES